VGTWPDGVRLTIYRETERTQEDDLIAGELHDPEAEELRADKQMAISQELYETTQRQISVPITDEAATLELPPSGDRANKFIACDADGNFIAAASVTGVPVTSFAETLLDDEDATEARATLGIEATGAEINLQCDKSANVKVLDEAGYTVLDDDGILWILVETGSSDRTITLPTAADNYKRVLHIIKTDPTGAGAIIVDGEGSETVDDELNIMVRQAITLLCTGTAWVSLHTDSIPVGAIIPYAGNNTTLPGFLRCDGSTFNRTVYSRLNTVLGNSWGNGNNSHGVLPDLAGYFLRGQTLDATRDVSVESRTPLGGGANNAVGSYEPDMFQGHYHTKYNSVDRVSQEAAGALTAGAALQSFLNRTIMVGNPYTGENGTARWGNETRPKNVFVHFFIKF